MNATGDSARRGDGVGGTSVLITTFQRPDRLTACLEGLSAQSRPADEVVVVVHASDHASAHRVEQLSSAWPGLRCVRVGRHGSVAALNRGLAAAREEIVAVVDDDAVPNPDWLERITRTFERDPRIAAVGGRDIVIVDGRALTRHRAVRSSRRERDVGRIQWFGRMLGNHHLGEGGARDVDVLKGANMSLRRRAVIGHGYDERLRGRGAVVHTEMSVCLPLRRRGLRVVYDPQIVVMHYPAPRPHGDDRAGFDPEAAADGAHNEGLQLLDYLGPRRRTLLMTFWLAVGTTESPGLAVLARDLLGRRPAAAGRFMAAQRGRSAALKTSRSERPVSELLGREAQPGRKK